MSVADSERRGSPRPLLSGGIPLFILRRLLLGALTLFLASIVIFAATNVLPGDAARSILGQSATAESLAAVRAQLGLDRPLVVQYLDWAWNSLHLDFGSSLSFGAQPVSEIVWPRVVNSAILVALATLVSMPLAVAIGVFTAVRRDSRLDHGVSVVMLTSAALPEFVVAIALVVLFATTVLPILPAVSLVPPGTSPLSDASMLILPTLALVIAVVPYTARIMRATTIETLETDYVEMARLKGLPERRVVWTHAARNALAPTIQVLALNLVYLAGGIVVIEYVFAYPGIGTAMVDAVLKRDVPVVQALALLIAALYVVVNLAADVLTILVSPRLRTSMQ